MHRSGMEALTRAETGYYSSRATWHLLSSQGGRAQGDNITTNSLQNLVCISDFGLLRDFAPLFRALRRAFSEFQSLGVINRNIGLTRSLGVILVSGPLAEVNGRHGDGGATRAPGSKF